MLQIDQIYHSKGAFPDTHPTAGLVSRVRHHSGAPGDPAQLALGEGATAEAVEAKRRELGLDQPFLIQYLNWLKDIIFRFDFGNSYRSNISVAYQIQNYFPNTLKLSGMAVLLGVLIGVPIGIVAAVKQYSVFDNIVMSFAMIGMVDAGVCTRTGHAAAVLGHAAVAAAIGLFDLPADDPSRCGARHAADGDLRPA